LFGLGLALLLGASVAGAAQYPPGPTGTCTDTLTVVDVQIEPAGVCAPASGDTVYGVKGIVTGFDAVPTSFAFWIQQPGAGPWKGVQVFTGGTNYNAAVPGTPTGGNLVLGDQVIVYGRKLEFNGVTEMGDFDNSQSTNDIIIRRDSPTTAPVPSFYVGDVDQFNWVPALATNGEPYEGMLVKLRGPLTVGRIAGPGVGSRTMLVTQAGFPGDTAAIDGFSLTNITALPVGSVIDSAQGILHQAIINGVSSYRILMRDANDFFAASPPNLLDAYPISNTQIRLRFDTKLTTSTAQNTANYELASFGTVNAAVLEGDQLHVVLTITSGTVRGQNETVTAKTGITSISGRPMTANQNRTFVLGLLKLSEVQYQDPTGLGETPCHDRSRYTTPLGGNGTRVAYTGICVAAYPPLYYLTDGESHPDSLRGGMSVYAPLAAMTVGRRYQFAGQIQEFDGISTTIPDGETEGVATVYQVDLGPATLPAPRTGTVATFVDSTCDVAGTLKTAEDYEGMLVKLPYVRVTENRTAGQSFLVATIGSPDTMLISNNNDSYTYAADSAHTVSVTGILTFRNGNFRWRITPRSDADILDHGLNVGVTPTAQTLSFTVTPNPGRTPKVAFTLPAEADVDLSVFDLSGRRVSQIVHGKLPAGTYSQNWKRGTSGAGMYFFRLRVGDETRIERAVVLN
jgi:hypothetical protein